MLLAELAPFFGGAVTLTIALGSTTFTWLKNRRKVVLIESSEDNFELPEVFRELWQDYNADGLRKITNEGQRKIFENIVRAKYFV